MNATATLLISCPDAPGIVAAVASFIARSGGNIIHADQHTDRQRDRFLQRVEWELRGFTIPRERIAAEFTPIADRFAMEWDLRFSDQVKRTAILVSRQGHCLYDLLARWRLGELPTEVAVVVSNHPDHRSFVEGLGIPFHHIPVTPETKPDAEERMLAVLDEADVDLVVLARYMQILTDRFVDAYPRRIINIHHSFLPAFAGARPYHQAHARGVKIIGATAHYVTAELDGGPIIEQDVVRVSHRDSVADLVRKGRDLEQVVLARAVRLHLADRLLVYAGRTVVFD